MEEEKPVPKKRGRKSKKEQEELAAAEAANAKEAEVSAAAEEQQPAQEDIVPESESAIESETMDENLINQLQEKMSQHSQEAEASEPASLDGVWEGDPGDG